MACHSPEGRLAPAGSRPERGDTASGRCEGAFAATDTVPAVQPSRPVGSRPERGAGESLYFRSQRSFAHLHCTKRSAVQVSLRMTFSDKLYLVEIDESIVGI